MAANTPEPTQLRLISTPRNHPSRPDWRLSERTRRIGRQGIAEIRATLERARPPVPEQGSRRAS